MPAPREVSLVTCSCSARWGDLRKASGPDEDAADLELSKLRGLVPSLVRHWRLGHELQFRIAPQPAPALTRVQEMAKEAWQGGLGKLGGITAAGDIP